MLARIITGGQTGADQAGWRAARAFGIATRGWMPAGFLTEDGPRADLAEVFGTAELPGGDYATRRRRRGRRGVAVRRLDKPKVGQVDPQLSGTGQAVGVG